MKEYHRGVGLGAETSSLLKRKIASGENKPQVSLHVDNINGKLREESPGDLGTCHHLREQGRFMLRTRMWTYQ